MKIVVANIANIANIAYCNQSKYISLSTQNDTVSEKFRYGERRVPLVGLLLARVPLLWHDPNCSTRA